MLYRTLVSIPLIGLVAGSLAPQPHAQQSRKLNGTLEQSFLAQVERYATASGRIVYEAGSGLYSAGLSSGVPVQEIANGVSRLWHLTPDGTIAVVQAYVSGQSELCRIPTDGSGGLVPLTAMDEHTRASKLSPDGSWIVFQRNGSINLYSVPTDGSGPAVLLSTTVGAYSYAITSDSQRVVFQNNNRTRVYTVPIGGGSPPVLLHPPSAGVLNVDEFRVSADGSLVVMRGDLDEVNQWEIYAAPADGSGPFVVLNEPLLGGTTSPQVGISPDGTSVTFAADYDGVGAFSLYRVSGSGGPSVPLDTATGPRTLLEQTVSPDGERVVYRSGTGSVVELFSVPLDASAAPVRLNADLDPGENVTSDFSIDLGSARVVFRVQATQATAGRLYSAPLDGSAPAVALGPALPFGQGVRSGAYQVGAARVAFLIDATVPDALELWSAPLDGSAAAMALHPALGAGQALLDFVLNETGLRAVFRGDKDIDGLDELFIVPLDASLPPARRSINRKETTTVGDVTRFKLSADGTTAVYRADEEEGDDLYAVQLSGTPERVRLHALDALPGTTAFILTPDSARGVFTDGFRFFSVPVDASAAPQLIVPATGVFPFLARPTPDSSRLVYLTQPEFFSVLDSIRSAPIDGSSAPVELNVPRAFNGEITTAEVTSDSARVVYLGEQDTAGVVELYSAPAAGGAAPLRLNDTLPVGGEVQEMRIAPDASRVVYVADQSADDLFGLYSVPAAGGSAPVPLTTLADTSRRIADLEVSPDSATVVFAADVVADEQLGLYRVPVAGGAAPTELVQLPAGTELPLLSGLRISADSQWVVYGQIHDLPEHNGTFSIPLAGGTPVRLAAAGLLLALSPDSRTVVHATASAGGVLQDLWSVPIGGGTARKLNGNLALSSFSVQIDSDSRCILFHCDPVVPGRDDLYAASLAGDVPAFAVGRPLPGSTVQSMDGAFRPGTHSVVFLAEQDEVGVRELYLNELLAHPPRHLPR